MAHTDELRLMTQVARMYYERGLNQPEIATQLDLSQATISRLLKRAQQEKIVRITVSAPSGIYTDLEEALQKAFRLKAAIVVDCEQEDMDEYTLRNLGAAAAFYVESTLRRNEVVGVSSWSASMLATRRMKMAATWIRRRSRTSTSRSRGSRPASRRSSSRRSGRRTRSWRRSTRRRSTRTPRRSRRTPAIRRRRRGR